MWLWEPLLTSFGKPQASLMGMSRASFTSTDSFERSALINKLDIYEGKLDDSNSLSKWRRAVQSRSGRLIKEPLAACPPWLWRGGRVRDIGRRRSWRETRHAPLKCLIAEVTAHVLKEFLSSHSLRGSCWRFHPTLFLHGRCQGPEGIRLRCSSGGDSSAGLQPWVEETSYRVFIQNVFFFWKHKFFAVCLRLTKEMEKPGEFFYKSDER